MGTFNFYPEFVADQVLTAEHLNELFDYLDEQDRLTRRCLIGIGIVCGLEVTYTGSDITISRGVGVTSKGYLIDFAKNKYTHFRPYTLPLNPESPPPAESIINPFPYNTFKMYELIAAPEAGDTAISGSAAFLANYAVVLFLEIKATNLKNCTTNDCDDKGREITLTIKPLLIKKTDLGHPAFTCNDESDPSLSAGNIEAGKAALPEVLLTRYNVPHTTLNNAQAVLKAFHTITSNSAQSAVAAAYNKTYDTFKGLLGVAANPFTTLNTTLNSLFAQVQAGNALYSQYYYDFLDDLIKAYNELRQEGNAVISACCPCDKLFPYHLALGEADKNSKDSVSTYRNYFIYSPLFNDQKNRLNALKLLFDRMVELVKGFTFDKIAEGTKLPVKITPSTWSRSALSKRAIPFYYKPAPLFEKWNPERTRYGKQKTNLSYSSDSYNTSPVLDFVKQPLLYEIEPFTFFRIEGHVGKPYTAALEEILKIRNDFSLPFDVVVVKAAAFKESGIDFSKVTCQLNDLEIAYDIARREWEAIIGQTIEWLDDNKAKANTYVGRVRLATFIKKLHTAKTFMVDDLPTFISKYTDFMPLYEWIEEEAEAIRIMLMEKLEEQRDKIDAPFVEDLIDHFDEVMMSVKKGPFRALQQEFKRRLKSIYASQFLDTYAQKHPGLDHKAGVPRGGTFILVYTQGKESTQLAAPGTVIADFYVPYLCCSDCPPVAYIIEEVKPDPVRPTIDIAPKEFCNNDDKIYDVVASPAGGVLSGPGTREGFKFCPYGLPPGEILLTYTLDGQAVTVSVKIVAPGKADFTMKDEQQADGSFKVNFTPVDTKGTKYEWLVDGVLTYTDMLVEDKFTFEGKERAYKITLLVSFGPCAPVENTQELKLVKKEQALNEKRTVCFREKIPLEKIPAGTALEVLDNGGLDIQGAGIVLDPGKITETKTFVLSYRYTDAGGNTVTKTLELTIIVVKPMLRIKFMPRDATGMPERYVLENLTPGATSVQYRIEMNGAVVFTPTGNPPFVPENQTSLENAFLIMTVQQANGTATCTGTLSIPVSKTFFNSLRQLPDGQIFPKAG
jgi:hypothetical protein